MEETRLRFHMLSTSSASQIQYTLVDNALRSYAAVSNNWKTRLLSTCIAKPLDRVKMLGDDSEGHTGCVNALSWARNGEMLLSGGDDTTVRMWRMDPGDGETEYPFVCEGIINTGHYANIFNAQMLPHSSRIVTVAGDGEARVFDVGSGSHLSRYGPTSSDANRDVVRIIQCHSGPVKRIVTEDSPDVFLTVSEDGTVRQHDLRVPHSCRLEQCQNTPLIRMNHELYSLARSPLTPYQLVAAGDSNYGYLFDRRHGTRAFAADWRMQPDSKALTTCVRRFGRDEHVRTEPRRGEYITGARMADSNGHEVLLSYGSDAVYLFSTLDEPISDDVGSTSAVVPSNVRPKRRHLSRPGEHTAYPDLDHEWTNRNNLMEEDIERMVEEEMSSQDNELEEEEDDENRDDDYLSLWRTSIRAAEMNSPIVHPRIRYKGACNVRTTKDVNFIGPHDEFVVSGSDEGYFFIWNKLSGKLHDILEGDSTVVNVVEAHPSLPLVAVSGIDTTIKLFAPRFDGTQKFSKLYEADAILEHNEFASQERRIEVSDFLDIIRQSQGSASSQCSFQ